MAISCGPVLGFLFYFFLFSRREEKWGEGEEDAEVRVNSRERKNDE